MEENRKTGNSSRFLCTGPRNVWNVNAGAADLTGCSFLRMKRGEFLDRRRRRLLLAKQTHLFSIFFFYTQANAYWDTSGGSGRQEDGVCRWYPPPFSRSIVSAFLLFSLRWSDSRRGPSGRRALKSLGTKPDRSFPPFFASVRMCLKKRGPTFLAYRLMVFSTSSLPLYNSSSPLFFVVYFQVFCFRRKV
jgi:hypothetical protein